MATTRIAEAPLPPFYRLLENEPTRETLKDIRELDCRVPDVLPYFLRGGYPEPTLMDDDFARDAWMEDYFRTYVDPRHPEAVPPAGRSGTGGSWACCRRSPAPSSTGRNSGGRWTCPR